jgi:hypothetical protein
MPSRRPGDAHTDDGIVTLLHSSLETRSILTFDWNRHHYYRNPANQRVPSQKEKVSLTCASRLFRGTEADVGFGGDITQYRPNVRTQSRN